MTIGVGVIGCGVRGQHSYEQALARHPACRIVAVSQYPGISPAMLEGKDPVRHAREYAQSHGADYLDGHEQLLAREDVAIVSLMCEPRAAPALVEACCAAGKHIVRDKPMCREVADADRIVAAVEAADIRMLVTLGTRFAPALCTTREQVRAGAVGDLLTLTFTYLQAGGPLAGFTATPEYRDRVGGGELTNFGHYALDFLLWLVGAPVATVYATTATAFYPDYRTSGMEDLGQLSLRFANGVVGTVITGRTTTPHAPASYFRLDVTGTQGSVVCTGPQEQVVVTPGTPQPVGTSAAAIDAMIGAFVEAVATGAPSPIGAHEGRRLVRVLAAAYRSAAEGRPISPEERLEHHTAPPAATEPAPTRQALTK